MDNVLLVSGIACVIAAVIGGGLKAFGIEIPALASLARQALLGLVGAVLIVAGRPDLLPSRGGPSQVDQAASPQLDNGSPVAADTHDKRPADVGGPMSVLVNNDPREVAPGASTALTVLVTSSANSPVADALVVLETGGGTFQSTGATKVIGRTDAQGLFKTTWRTYEAGAYTGDMSYVVGVQVSKDGFESSRTEFSIPVRKSAQPLPPGQLGVQGG